MNYLASILALIPVLALGIQKLHSDKTLDQKTQFGADLLTLSTAGAATLLPGEEGQLAGAIGNIAQSTLAQAIAALHHQATGQTQLT